MRHRESTLNRFLRRSEFGSDSRGLMAWNVLTSSLDLLDDTEQAKVNYFRFQLVGPTRYDDTGEMYLRLYGILNAIYLQMSAITELSELFKLSDKNKTLKPLQQSLIVQLRHIAASHTVNFMEPVSKRKRSHMISQYSLRDEKIVVMDDDNKFQEFNIPQLIKDFDKTAEAILDKVVLKATQAICKTEMKSNSDFSARLDRIRRTSQGDVFIDVPDLPGIKTVHVEVVKGWHTADNSGNNDVHS